MHHASANSSAYGKVKDVMKSLTGSESPFSQSSQVGIITEKYWDIEPVFQYLTEVQTIPAGDIGDYINNAQRRVDITGGGYTDGTHVSLGWPKLSDQSEQAVDGFFTGCLSWDTLLLNHFSADGVKCRDAELGTADVTCNECFHIEPIIALTLF